MRKLTNPLLIVISVFLLWGCPNGTKKIRYYDAWFPEYAVNFTDVNSAYDDYNSALPETHFGRQLIFSSNRRSSGGEFDIIGENLHATWYWETGLLTVDNSTYWQNTNYVNALLSKVDKNDNQFAPYTLAYDSEINDIGRRINMLAYSTNSNSNCYRSEFLYHISDSNDDENGVVYGPYTIPFLGDCVQQYISFFGPNVYEVDHESTRPNEFTQLYFDKINNDKSDIHYINIPDSLEFMEFLISEADFNLELASELNSSSNDKCPFINGYFMVFTSDRPGGYGGYDLYYSYNNNGNWLEPINFGERINSEYDEFRPLTMSTFGYKNDLMVFSSNRPGGLGGYDLYYVGIDKMIPIAIE